jgi:hypothetical protein
MTVQKFKFSPLMSQYKKNNQRIKYKKHKICFNKYLDNTIEM